MVSNIIRAIILLTIAKIITTIAVGHGKKNVMFVAKKVVALTNIQMMNNKRYKNFGGKTENFAKIKANTMLFLLIMRGIRRMILIISMKKQII